MRIAYIERKLLSTPVSLMNSAGVLYKVRIRSKRGM